MKLILVNQRYGHTRTIVIRGWMKGLLSLCLLGAPVALGYLGYELALADNSNALVSQEAKVSSDEFVSSVHHAVLPAYQSASSEHPADNGRGTENFHHALAVAASVIRPLVLLASDLSVKYHTRILAVFAHGRLIDPSVYASHTRH